MAEAQLELAVPSSMTANQLRTIPDNVLLSRRRVTTLKVTQSDKRQSYASSLRPIGLRWSYEHRGEAEIGLRTGVAHN